MLGYCLDTRAKLLLRDLEYESFWIGQFRLSVNKGALGLD